MSRAVVDEVVRHPTARTIRLTLNPLTGRSRLTVPKRAALAPALVWAEGKAAWLAEQRTGLPEPRPFVDGAVLPFADRGLTLRRVEDARSSACLWDDVLTAGGPIETASRIFQLWLKREALALLTTETAEFAEKAGVTVERVTIGDAKGRWASCGSRGAIRYNWRLIFAPGFVRRATVAHEVAHRVHMNHSSAFHALVAELFGSDPRPARDWLRANGATLHWFGRSS